MPVRHPQPIVSTRSNPAMAQFPAMPTSTPYGVSPRPARARIA
jgi:hypothetical protein